MTQTTDTPERWLTSADVCGELHIDRSTLSRWVQSGRIVAAHKLPGIRGAYLFHPDEVARLRGGDAA